MQLLDVLKSFLRAEVRRPRFRDLLTLFDRDDEALWLILGNHTGAVSISMFRKALKDPDSLDQVMVMHFVRCLGEYGKTRIPLVPFTVGSADDDRTGKVAGWILKDLPLDKLWMPDADPNAATALDDSGFNLAKAAVKLADPECRPPADETTEPIICFENKSRDGKSDFQVLDGFHRVIRAAKNNHETLPAYLGLAAQSESTSDSSG